jgi:hypothetical protein
MLNEISVQGKIQKIRTFKNERGVMVVGWLDQREVSAFTDGSHDREIYKFGINIVSFEPDVVNALSALDAGRMDTPHTSLVTLKGSLKTKFPEKDSGFKPQLQLIVDEIVS